jgi:hypothetical protein
MKRTQKTFATDLLKALDIAINGKLRDEEAYRIDMCGLSRKEVIRAVKYLETLGYRKQENKG